MIADLAQSDVSVALLLSEHKPFDLIAISPRLELCRLSVKYRRATKGKIYVPLKSYWSDRRGTHMIKHDKTNYDALAIYCPDTRETYYIRTDEVRGHSCSLRLDPSRNGQVSDVRYASDYRHPHRLFEERLRRAGDLNGSR